MNAEASHGKRRHRANSFQQEIVVDKYRSRTNTIKRFCRYLGPCEASVK